MKLASLPLPILFAAVHQSQMGPKTDLLITLAPLCFEGEERKWPGLAAM